MGRRRKDDGLRTFFKVLFIIYIIAVMYITLLDREPEEQRFDLEPFRSYYLLIREGNQFYFKQIFYNILMTVPFGFILPFIYKSMRSFYTMTFMGFIFSMAIEMTQYITCRGLFEFDDLFNNTIGASIGYILFVIVHNIIIFLIDHSK